MDTDEAKLATAIEMVEAWNKLDWDRVIDLFAEDGLLHSMMEDEPTVGRPALRRRIQALCDGATEVRIELRNAGVINGAVFLERVDNFVINDRAGSMPVVGVLEIEDGLVQAWREYYDRATLLRGMGLERDFVHDL
ncbi:limonene-1,2-epoxide hydrolase [Frankineae bacterium MT45]|nr:limonene-1,2-epoxide hydrolase [Frankineae bacterium MT45]